MFYFPILQVFMKLFRLHITRIYGFFLLLIAIGLNIANITEQKAHHEAFTSWLGSQLKNDDSEARLKIDNLSTDQSELEVVIRKASEVVTSYADDFKLPVGTEDEIPNSEQVFHLLLTQWNQFRNTEAGMSKAVLVESAKAQTILPNDGKIVISSTTNQRKTELKNPSTYLVNAENSLNLSFFLSPLESGTAIGAP